IPITLLVASLCTLVACIMKLWKQIPTNILIFGTVIITGMMFFHSTKYFTYGELQLMSQAQMIHDDSRWADCNFASWITHSGGKINFERLDESSRYECIAANNPHNPPGYVFYL